MRDRIFKGCTRPAMKLGVPLVPLVVVVGGCFLAGMWGTVLLRSLWPAAFALTLLVGLLTTMRAITKKDDQRFKQMGLWLLLRVGNRNRRFWGATSYAPARYSTRR